MRFDRDTHTVHAGGRSWRADPTHTMIEDIDTSLSVHRQRACLVRFESGWAASIIWGSSTYSSNHDTSFGEVPFTEEPTTVEVGVIDSHGVLRMRRFHDDEIGEWHEVESYTDDDALVRLLDELATMPSDFDFGAPPPSREEMMEALRDYASKVVDRD